MYIFKQCIINLCKFVFILDKALVFNDSDEEIMTLFSSTASKVVIKNFKQLDETDLSKLLKRDTVINLITDGLQKWNIDQSINCCHLTLSGPYLKI